MQSGIEGREAGEGGHLVAGGGMERGEVAGHCPSLGRWKGIKEGRVEGVGG